MLVVEDQKKAATFIRKALLAEGFAVDVAEDGETALTLAGATPFDAIVLDIMLPGRDGLSVLRLLRERRVATPVPLLSARSEVNERVEGLNAGRSIICPSPSRWMNYWPACAPFVGAARSKVRPSCAWPT